VFNTEQMNQAVFAFRRSPEDVLPLSSELCYLAEEECHQKV
jgi:hypothetical protein